MIKKENVPSISLFIYLFIFDNAYFMNCENRNIFIFQKTDPPFRYGEAKIIYIPLSNPYVRTIMYTELIATTEHHLASKTRSVI